MIWQQNPYSVMLFLSALVSLVAGLYAWTRRPAPGASAVGLAMMAATLWSFGYAMEIALENLAGKVFWAKFQYLGIASLAVIMLWVTLEYAGFESGRWRRFLPFLCLPALATLLLVWTNEKHGWIWASVNLGDQPGVTILSFRYGLGFWFHAAYSYVLLGMALLLLLRSYRKSAFLQRGQFVMLILALAFPWIGNLLYLFRLNPVPWLDLTPFMYTLSGLALAWGLFRYRLMDILPVAWDTVIEGFADSVIVLDEKNRLVNLNPMAQQIFGPELAGMIGQPAERVFARWISYYQRYANLDTVQDEIQLELNGQVRSFDLRVSPVLASIGQKRGRVVVLRDITTQKQSEKALLESQQQLAIQNDELLKLTQAVEQSASIVIVTDLNGRFEYVNPKFVEVTGYTREEALGQSTNILKSGRQGKEVYWNLWATIQSGNPWSGEFLNRCKDGSLYWAQATIAPVLDTAGRITHYIAVQEDVTARKAAEIVLQQYAQRLEVLYEIAQGLIMAQEPTDIAASTVERLRQLIPCQRVLILEQMPDGAVQPLAWTPGDFQPDLQVYQQLLQVADLQRGQAWVASNLAEAVRADLPVDTWDAAGIHSFASFPLITQEKLLGVLQLEANVENFFDEEYRSTAAQIAASLAVAVQQARLLKLTRQEVAERRSAQAALQSYAMELEDRNAELDAFAQTVAHDLKNPLTIVLGYTYVLQKNFESFSSEEALRMLKIVSDMNQKMAGIINELLLLARVRTVGEVDCEPLDMTEIIVDALERVQNLVSEKQAEIRILSHWPVAVGYAPWVAEVWANYLSNALKYGVGSEQGGSKIIELGYDEIPVSDRQEATSQIRFWVRDHGPGLTEAQQARLFTEFTRLKHVQKLEGHGLGLSIIRRIVEKLGGKVGVESEPGQGSRFYFTLPAMQQPIAPTTPPAHSAPPGL